MGNSADIRQSNYRIQTPDRIIWIAVLILLVVGVLMVYSASSYLSEVRFDDQFHYLKRQFIFAITGLILMRITMSIKYWKYKTLIPLIALICYGSLILVFIPGIGVERNGALRWINLGFTLFQPSELSKLCLIILLAWFLERKGERIKTFGMGVMPALVLGGVACALIVANDLSTTAIIAVTSGVMLFIAGMRWLHLGGLLIAGGGAFALAVSVKGYRLSRLYSFFNPWADASGSGYQVIQSLYALGPGGLIGRGLGNSRQKMLFLPEPHTDFIFSIIGEELGLIATVLIVTLFIVIGIRGFQIAKNAPDLFGRLLASGITASILIQAFMNIMVVTALLPVTGVPLPFISSGGTSLWITMASMGILLNISRHSNA